MIDELDEVVLTCDLPDHGLAAGDIGTVVLVHDGGKGYEVERKRWQPPFSKMLTAMEDALRDPSKRP